VSSKYCSLLIYQPLYSLKEPSAIVKPISKEEKKLKVIYLSGVKGSEGKKVDKGTSAGISSNFKILFVITK
jgi:hypothetical protein